MLLIYMLVYFLSPKFYPIVATRAGDMVDAASRLFSCANHINSTQHLMHDNTTWSNTTSRATSHADGGSISFLAVRQRPDIKTFGFDLGGTSCACKLQWDRYQYWQRVFYGVKYVQSHIFTAFIAVLMSHRWQWVLLYKFLNEIVEELSLPIFGQWALTSPFADTESRYDSLINDCLLAAVPFTALGCHFVYSLGLPDPFQTVLQYDTQTVKTLSVSFFQFWFLININNFFDKFADTQYDLSALGLTADLGKICTFWLQLFVLGTIWRMKAWPRQHFLPTAICLLFIWLPFMFHHMHTFANEQIAAMLSLALAGYFTCYLQITLQRHNFCLVLFSMICYTTSLIVYCQLVYSVEPWIAAPTDKFYYNRGTCGVSETKRLNINSCAAVIAL